MGVLTTVTKGLISVGKQGYAVGKKASKYAQLNLRLKIERDKQQGFYEEIGKFIHHGQDASAASSEQVRFLREKITISERKILRLVEEINIMKQISSCPYCGYVGNENQKYCGRCGR